MAYAMCTLPSPKASSSVMKKEQTSADGSCAQGGPQTLSSFLKIQTYCDALFALGGGRGRGSILVLLVDEITCRVSLVLWQSRRLGGHRRLTS